MNKFKLSNYTKLKLKEKKLKTKNRKPKTKM